MVKVSSVAYIQQLGEQSLNSVYLKEVMLEGAKKVLADFCQTSDCILEKSCIITGLAATLAACSVITDLPHTIGQVVKGLLGFHWQFRVCKPLGTQRPRVGVPIHIQLPLPSTSLEQLG